MTKDQAIIQAKTFRKEADELLQRMKKHKDALFCAQRGGVSQPFRAECIDSSEVIAQHILSIRDLESCIMRQGMALKYIGQPDPYPESRNPDSTVVEPTADGLKL
jgi:hypothetical protein